MTKLKMTHEQCVKVFIQFTNHLGPWDKMDWRDRYHPSTFSSMMEMSSLMDEILARLVKRGVFKEDRIPADNSMLFRRLKECLSTNPNLHKRQYARVQQSRLAAYEGGFIRMADILYLESVCDIKKINSDSC